MDLIPARRKAIFTGCQSDNTATSCGNQQQQRPETFPEHGETHAISNF